jgi:prepilin-type N-terminal cleavage/methylation domain-containing protein
MLVPRSRRGFSLIELLIVIAIILLIITIAVPKFNSVQKHAREVAALQAIKTIHTGQVQFYSEYGRYATSLTELGPPASGHATASAADLIGNDLASGEKQGYRFTVTGNAGGYVGLRHQWRQEFLLRPDHDDTRKRRSRAGHGAKQGNALAVTTP